jgi:hypothetical protein
MNIDITKSLEELENDYWPEKEIYETSLIETIYKIRKKPLEQLKPGEIRYFVGQNMGNKYIVPIALKLLEENPYALGTYYEGDLLMAVLNIDVEFWVEFKELLRQLSIIIVNINKYFSEEIEDLIPDGLEDEINNKWKNLLDSVMSKLGETMEW